MGNFHIELFQLTIYLRYNLSFASSATLLTKAKVKLLTIKGASLPEKEDRKKEISYQKHKQRRTENDI